MIGAEVAGEGYFGMSAWARSNFSLEDLCSYHLFVAGVELRQFHWPFASAVDQIEVPWQPHAGYPGFRLARTRCVKRVTRRLFEIEWLGLHSEGVSKAMPWLVRNRYRLGSLDREPSRRLSETNTLYSPACVPCIGEQSLASRFAGQSDCRMLHEKGQRGLGRD